MNLITLSLAIIFVIIPLFLSKTLNLGLEKDTIIATIRSIFQLLFIGYLHQYIFDSENIMYILLMVVLMIAAAVQNARTKGVYITGIIWKLAVTFLFVEVLTQAILLGLDIIPPTAQYIIPISGMVIGNSMVFGILFLNRLIAEMSSHQGETELILSLGGTPKQAIHRQLIASIKASTIPTIEQQKVTGLVQLPGMMSGLIISGADPVQAVMFQLLVLFLILTAAVITSVMLAYLSYPTLFNQRMQLLEARLKQ